MIICSFKADSSHQLVVAKEMFQLRGTALTLPVLISDSVFVLLSLNMSASVNWIVNTSGPGSNSFVTMVIITGAESVVKANRHVVALKTAKKLLLRAQKVTVCLDCHFNTTFYSSSPRKRGLTLARLCAGYGSWIVNHFPCNVRSLAVVQYYKLLKHDPLHNIALLL